MANYFGSSMPIFLFFLPLLPPACTNPSQEALLFNQQNERLQSHLQIAKTDFVDPSCLPCPAHHLHQPLHNPTASPQFLCYHPPAPHTLLLGIKCETTHP